MDQKLQTGLEESQKRIYFKRKAKKYSRRRTGEKSDITKRKESFLYYARLEDLHLRIERIDRKIREEIKKSFAYTSEMSPELAEHSVTIIWIGCFLCLGISIHKMRNDLEKSRKV